jgi:hypothetical protein
VSVTAAEREQLAREALAEVAAPGTVGDLLGETPDADGVITLRFASTLGGYPGWMWNVSLVELEGEAPTVLEAELLPGDGALLAPEWIPWSQRLEEYRAAIESDEEDADDDSDDEVEDSDLLAVGEDEQDEPEAEADEDAPEPPAVTGVEDGGQEDQ